ncbi:MAG: phosphoribosylamine--glycine ligase [Planctomycetota bacterium]|nr:MAG: phosphoribosylamine--glycine ligase [Planctomycetota bacterium]
MKVLVVGGGGREHALVWKIKSSPLVQEIVCAPGNPGTAKLARNVEIAANDVQRLVELAEREKPDLVVVGPEEPLVLGLADQLRKRGVRVFGPGARGARIEGSKLYAKEILERHRIPTGGYKRFDRAGSAKGYLESCKYWPQVVKADGLAAGKGVFVCADAREACAVVDTLMEQRKLGAAGEQIVVEEFLDGQEVSVLSITDGRGLLIFEPAIDHKQVGDGDTGANTGGMGVLSPAPWVTRRLMRQIESRVLLPTLHALTIEEVEFQGLLYAGLMVNDGGPRVLEFNCRFGDPETQVLVRRFKSDLVPYLVAAADGKLADMEPPEWDARVCIGVVMCAEGYPGEYRKGDPILGLEKADAVGDVVAFVAGAKQQGKALVTSGGRVLCVTALGADVEEARAKAYEACGLVRWQGAFFRRDIGLRRERAPVGPPDSHGESGDVL